MTALNKINLDSALVTPLDFRVWDEQNGKMHHIHSSVEDFNVLKLLLKRENKMMRPLESADKNGMKIYQGDILRYHNPDSNKAHPLHLVCWSTVRKRFVFRKEDGSSPQSIDDIDVHPERWQVIGNICQNPEFLPTLTNATCTIPR